MWLVTAIPDSAALACSSGKCERKCLSSPLNLQIEMLAPYFLFMKFTTEMPCVRVSMWLSGIESNCNAGDHWQCTRHGFDP